MMEILLVMQCDGDFFLWLADWSMRQLPFKYTLTIRNPLFLPVKLLENNPAIHKKDSIKKVNILRRLSIS